MEALRVFALWHHLLFLDSVRQILKHPGVEWVGATSDYATALEEIARLQPDTVLVEEAESAEISAQIVAILDASKSDIQVVRLSMADNQLTLYHREQRVAAQVSDLLRLVQRGPAKGEAVEEPP